MTWVVGRMMVSKDIHILICECYLTQQKGLCRCDEEWGPWDGKIILKYLGGPDLIHGSLKASLLAEVRIRASCVYRRMVREMQYCWLWRRKGAKECGQPLEAGKGKQMDSPLALPGKNAALLRHPSPLFLKCLFLGLSWSDSSSYCCSLLCSLYHGSQPGLTLYLFLTILGWIGMYVVIFPTIPLYFADKEAKVQKRLSELLKSYG